MTDALPLHRVIGQRKMVIIALLGFASGLPLYLTSRVLQAWMRVEQIDLATIGLFSLVALPYSLKFLWAPLMDRFVPPFLGRRRGWLIVTQVLLLIAIAAMSLQDPRRGIQLLAVNAMLIAFFSASQDIVSDAYRTDILNDREMGAGASMGVLGYRIALLATGALAFVLADKMPWPTVYLLLSLLLFIGMIAVFNAPEPPVIGKPVESFAEAVLLPFGEFFGRAGFWRALLVLVFIVLYKLPDAYATAMATPFLLDLDFTQADIGAIQGGLGIGATIVGTIAAGPIVTRLGLNKSLWLFAALQAASNLAYYALALAGREYGMLVSAIIVENFCTGLVSAGFVAFLMSLCSTRFSATQYALLSSLLGVSRDLFTAPAGAVAQSTGWPLYFLLTLIVAIPGILMLPLFVPWNRDVPVMAASRTSRSRD
jgi:MFS transporter, PAT family, beta-lactamase induction signal transducer AmpG